MERAQVLRQVVIMEEGISILVTAASVNKAIATVNEGFRQAKEISVNLIYKWHRGDKKYFFKLRLTYLSNKVQVIVLSPYGIKYYLCICSDGCDIRSFNLTSGNIVSN